MSRESSITVAVRIRPFTSSELGELYVPRNNGDMILHTNNENNLTQSANRLLQRQGIRKILNAVDDRMLIFDPADTNPLVLMEQNAFPNGFNSNRNKETRKSSIGYHSSRIREHRFVFDKLFDEDSTQEQVYECTTQPLLESVIDGFNSTIFAYGATGCGKTHTISGTPDSPGIIFLAMRQLFDRIEEMKDSYHVDVTLSYLEIYNETIKDLLDPSIESRKLMLREDSNKKISVANLSTRVPRSVEDVMDMIVTGNNNRTVSPTEANLTSSRSHAVLQVNVTKKPRTSQLSEEHTIATLSIIDLAGSERASATKNKGARLHEGANINKSLLALGNCINALCDPRKRNHVPYRDSKLTRLLKFSLGGNCKTFMIVCVSPSSRHYDETLNTLKYADRAKEIKTKLIRNQQNLSRHVGSYLKLITEQKNEIEELRNRENKMIELGIQKLTRKREICQEKLFDAIDELKKSVKKAHGQMVQKAYILAKRKLMILQKVQIEQFISSFSERFGTSHDMSEIDMFVPGFNQLLVLSTQLVDKLTNHIRELEDQYVKPTELDFIIKDSSRAILRTLANLESWTEYDTELYENFVANLKESIERSILFESSLLFDQSLQKLTSFKFIHENLLRTLAILLDISSENQQALDNVGDSLKEIVVCCKDSFKSLLDDDNASGISIDLSNIRQQDTSLSSQVSAMALSPFQPLVVDPNFDNNITVNNLNIKKLGSRKSGKRLSSSPLTKPLSSKKLNRFQATSPISIPNSKIKLLNNKTHRLSRTLSDASTFSQLQTGPKKVRWDVPDSSSAGSDTSNSFNSEPPMIERRVESSPLRNLQTSERTSDEDESIQEAEAFTLSDFSFDAKKFTLIPSNRTYKQEILKTKQPGTAQIGNKLTSRTLQPTSCLKTGSRNHGSDGILFSSSPPPPAATTYSDPSSLLLNTNSRVNIGIPLLLSPKRETPPFIGSSGTVLKSNSDTLKQNIITDVGVQKSSSNVEFDEEASQMEVDD